MSKRVSWYQLKQLPLTEMIDKLEREVEKHDAELRGIVRTLRLTEDKPLGHTLITMGESLGKEGRTRAEEDIVILGLIDALKSGLVDLEKRVKKLEELDEMR